MGCGASSESGGDKASPSTPRAADTGGGVLLEVAGLHEAAVAGSVSETDRFLASGEDVNGVDAQGRTPLLVASAVPRGSRRQADVVKRLLEAPGVDVNKANPGGRTPLHAAAAAGNVEVVEELLAGPDIEVNQVDGKGRTALFLACQKGREAVVKALLGSSFEIDWALENVDSGISPLVVALANGHEVIAEDLKAYGAVVKYTLTSAAYQGSAEELRKLLDTEESEPVDVNVVDPHGRTPLSWAAWNGHAEAVSVLLSATGVDVNAVDEKDRTALFGAAGKGHVEVCQLLLAHPEVDVNLTNRKGRTPLKAAAYWGHASVVSALLAHPNVDAAREDTYGRDALSAATYNGHVEATRLLVEHPGVSTARVDEDGYTPLMTACTNKMVEMVEVLLTAPDAAQSINMVERMGRTALFFACEFGALDIVQALLKADGIDINYTENGTTPLVIALAFGRLEVAEFMKQHGAEPRYTLRSACLQGNVEEVARLLQEPDAGDINDADPAGRTALFWAVWADHAPVVMLLLRQPGINVNCADGKGVTPLTWATRKSHFEVMELLRDAGAV